MSINPRSCVCQGLAKLEYPVSVLKDLDFPAYLSPILFSEIEGVEKPSPEFFQLILRRVNAELEIPITPPECVHVGDEVEWCVSYIPMSPSPT
jgi:FMN phosphatase YigB (HAD superfamily)